MRCPHCAGDILDGSRFCGICGRRLAPGAGREHEPARASVPAGESGPSRAPGVVRVERVAPHTAGEASRAGPQRGTGPPRDAAPGPLELPVSRGARWARILVVLVLDVVLAGAGAIMILSYLRDCEGRRSTATAPGAGAPAGPVTSSEERSTPETRP